MKPQTHNDFRKSVCLGCHKPGARRKVSPKSKLELKVREKIFSGYSAEDMGLPVGLCGGCERAIYKDKPFPSLGVNYDTLKVSRQDVQDGVCSCYICTAGRSKKKLSLKRKRGRPSTENQEVSNKVSKPKVIKVCPVCKQKVGKGIRHPQPCKGSDKVKVDNILVLAEGDQVLEEKICSSVIQKKGKATDQEDITIKSKQGRNLRVKVNQKKQEEVFIEHDVLDVMREAGNMTDKGIIKAERALKKKISRNKFQSRYREKLSKTARKAADFLRYYFKLYFLSDIYY